MKRLIRKESAETREFVIRNTPTNPSFPGQFDPQFQDSDDKSYSRMMNMHTIQKAKERGEKDKLDGTNIEF